jgi:Fe-S-cluster containining protein
MDMDFTEFFERYEAIVREVDKAFQAVAEQYPEAVKCELGCSDCCYAMFDLSLVEAMYLNHHFNRLFSGPQRSAVKERADTADREAYRIKRRIFKGTQEGRKADELLEEVAKMRVRCPLLDDEDTCELYEHRPVTCRVYGMPMTIEGRSHTCGLSGFEPGKPYPTVNLEAVQDRLMELSQELVQSLPTRNVLMADVLVPVSMALLTEYNEAYLGIVEGAEPPAQAAAAGCEGKGGHTWTLDGPKGSTDEPLSCATCDVKDTDACQPEQCGGAPDSEA